MDATITIEEKREIREKVSKPLLWIGMISMSMVFAGLTSAYVVRQGKGDWLNFDLPQLFYVSTAIILISSVTMNWTLSAARKGKSEYGGGKTGNENAFRRGSVLLGAEGNHHQCRCRAAQNGQDVPI